MREVFNFSQHDLNVHDVMVLDFFSTVFMWLGPKSNKTERANVAKKVDDYINACTDGRKPEKVQVVPVEPCSESIVFKAAFPEWEEDVAKAWFEPDAFEAAVIAAKAEREKYMAEKYGANEDFAAAGETKFSLDELKAGCPDGVDPTKKEAYLSAEDF